jgi:hypothetical protein
VKTSDAINNGGKSGSGHNNGSSQKWTYFCGHAFLPNK